MINARSETARTKPAFADALKYRRCLIPADGFYEWKRTGNSKQPYCFEVNRGALFAFAGVWDQWLDASGARITTCSILTTVPNAVTSAVHNRMPVILDAGNYDLWLDPGMRNLHAVCDLLMPYDSSQMRSYPVSSRINHVAHDDEECSRPRELGAQQVPLFGSQFFSGRTIGESATIPPLWLAPVPMDMMRVSPEKRLTSYAATCPYSALPAC